MDADDTEVLKWLSGQKGNFEVYRERTYAIERHGAAGTVALTIRDAGATAAPGHRYMCSAVGSNGKKALGNPGDTLSEALHNVHWRDLD